MPKATVSQETVRKDLKSCEGGFVVLKKLPFGLLLERRDNASKLSMHGGDDKVDIALMQRWSRQFEFGHCIIDHNLEDETVRSWTSTMKCPSTHSIRRSVRKSSDTSMS